MKGLYIIGAGGHGQVIYDCAVAQGFKVLGFVDDNRKLWGAYISGTEVIGPISVVRNLDCLLVVAVGDNKKRENIVKELGLVSEKYAKIIHPSAVIGSSVEILEGSMIIGGVVINTQTKIGRHVIINTHSSIDHHNIIGDFVHIAPGVHTGGAVEIGEGTFVGIGASIINNIRIGKNVIVGAGSVVISDIPDNVVVVGVPAKVVKRRDI
ncbi:MAG: acetyltransferase [Candidatus Parvarchaeota archaeon]|nr:acetyltransferase [Candidatus Rehaiarchaeum fermentans]